MAKGIYKRHNTYWIRYSGLDGKIVRESSGSHSFSEAKLLLIKRLNAVKEGRAADLKKIPNHSFAELAEKYLEWANGRQRSVSTKRYIVKQLLYRFGNLQLRRFNTLLVEQYQTYTINRGLKNASCNKHMNILKHMFSKAVDWEMVEEHILKLVRKVKLLPEESRLRFISTDECHELISASEPHLKPIVTTALNTGMRKGEILKLQWDKHIDLKHNFIMLDKTKNGERGKFLSMTLSGRLYGRCSSTGVQIFLMFSMTPRQVKGLPMSNGHSLQL